MIIASCQSVILSRSQVIWGQNSAKPIVNTQSVNMFMDFNNGNDGDLIDIDYCSFFSMSVCF